MKYARYIGMAAAFFLIISCFLPLAYYPDLGENFTGFYSKQNNYGRPGIAFIFLSLVSVALFLVPRLGAIRANQFVAVLILAYSLKTYIIFSACYYSVCPQVKPGLVGIVLFSIIILICTLLSKPNTRNVKV